MPTPPQAAEQTRATLLIRLNGTGAEREVAWEEFYDLYAPVISGFARRMGARAQEVDDLVQEVMNAFFRISPEFHYDPAAGRFRGYLKTCVWNKLSRLRKNVAQPTTVFDRFQPSDPDQVAVESVWNDVWEIEKLGRALTLTRQRYSTNSDRQRTFRAFEMCTLLDRRPEEVAIELGLSAESVRAAKSRVSKALRQAFDQFDQIIG